MPYVPTETPPADKPLPYLKSFTLEDVIHFYEQVEVQHPPLERPETAEILWPFKPKPVQIDTD